MRTAQGPLTQIAPATACSTSVTTTRPTRIAVRCLPTAHKDGIALGPTPVGSDSMATRQNEPRPALNPYPLCMCAQVSSAVKMSHASPNRGCPSLEYSMTLGDALRPWPDVHSTTIPSSTRPDCSLRAGPEGSTGFCGGECCAGRCTNAPYSGERYDYQCCPDGSSDSLCNGECCGGDCVRDYLTGDYGCCAFWDKVAEELMGCGRQRVYNGARARARVRVRVSVTVSSLSLYPCCCPYEFRVLSIPEILTHHHIRVRTSST